MRRKYVATEKNVRRLLKSSKLFGIWLAKQKSLTLGMASTCWACPIRLYLGNTFEQQIEVHSCDIKIYSNGKEESSISLEDYEWVQKFIKEIDNCPSNLVPTIVARSAFKQVSSP